VFTRKVTRVQFIGDDGAPSQPGVSDGVATYFRSAIDRVASRGYTGGFIVPPLGMAEVVGILLGIAREHDISRTTLECPIPGSVSSLRHYGHPDQR